MKNGIIIDGRQYELQEVDPKSIGENDVCDVCDLDEKCNEIYDAYEEVALCTILHGAGCNCAYRYIGKADEK